MCRAPCQVPGWEGACIRNVQRTGTAPEGSAEQLGNQTFSPEDAHSPSAQEETPGVTSHSKMQTRASETPGP